MLDGVTVVNATEIFKHVGFGDYAVIFLMLCSVCATISLSFSENTKYEKTLLSLTVATLIFGVIGGIGIYLRWYDLNTYDYTKYEVVADDDVALNDFLSRYEILEYTGDTYIIRERGNS